MYAILKRFDIPDELREFEKGKFEVVRIGDMTIGRATYEPGWRWSEHVGMEEGERSCHVDHVGMIVCGRMMVRMDDGREIEMTAGDLFSIGPGHDAWVIGDETYVSLHFGGADYYASKGE